MGRFGQVAADEGDGAARVERMPLDAVLGKLARPVQRAIDPLETLFMPAQPRLGDAVQQRKGRILELALLARAQELYDRGMVTGSREFADFCGGRRLIAEALDSGVALGHWESIPGFPVRRPL